MTRSPSSCCCESTAQAVVRIEDVHAFFRWQGENGLKHEFHLQRFKGLLACIRPLKHDSFFHEVEQRRSYR